MVTISWHPKNLAQLWEIPNGKHIRTISKEHKEHVATVTDVSFSLNSKFMITSDWSGIVNLWRIQEGHLSYIFKDSLKDPNLCKVDDKGIILNPENCKADDIGINSVSFSPDDNFIVSGSKDGTVKLWSKEGQLLDTFKDPHNKDGKPHGDIVTSISFSSDGQFIATASYDKTIKLWKRESNQDKYKYIQTLDRHADHVWSVRFSPDDNFIATGSKDATIKIWQKQNDRYEYFKTLEGHNNTVTSISFSSKDNTLASASMDEKVILWNSYQKELDELLIDACDWARDYLNNNPNVSEIDKKLCK